VEAAAGPILPSAAALPPILARAALVASALGAGCLLGSLLAEPPPAPGVSAAVMTAAPDHGERIRDLEERLEEARRERDLETAWRQDLEARLRSTQEAIAQLSSRLAALDGLANDPA
jgi:hypothetical protein